jgi:hypothetical protein
MASFTWTNTKGGDWSEAANWAGLGTPPPGVGDSAIFADLANQYTVTVQAGTTTVDAISVNSTKSANDVSFDILGTLTADIHFVSVANTPTDFRIEAGGALIVPTKISSDNAEETVVISGEKAGARVELGGLTVAAGDQNIIFDFFNDAVGASAGVIQIDGAISQGDVATQRIFDVAEGNQFVFTNADFTGDTVFYDSTNDDLIVRNGLTPVFTMNDVFLQPGRDADFTIVNGNTILAGAVCYVRGTMLRTPSGELPIEQLRPGMQVITLIDGQELPQAVTWIGHRRISLAAHPRPETVAPIRIERDAFADAMPHRDLLVSPDHAVFVDGKLICARQLVNGTTIRQERDGRAVHYYHVELDQHGILLAEGLPAESYLDTGNSGFFANSGVPLVLHPDLTDETDYPTREADSCAPFVTDAASVQPVWQRLADRAAAIGRRVPQRVTTPDSALRVLANGRPIKPVVSDSDRVIFVLPRGTDEVRLLSRAQSPTEARPWLEDRRQLGVRVKRIVLRGGDDVREVPVDHPDLTRGWWAVERDGQIISRWTDGAAVLPLPAMSGIVMLEIHLAGSMLYAVDLPEVRLTEAA